VPTFIGIIDIVADFIYGWGMQVLGCTRAGPLESKGMFSNLSWD
jgi:hypothetical protein